jgi:predicted RNase H-like HicB family nuclease
MKPNLRKQAEGLAERPYILEVVLDETTDGQPVYVAYNPELEGCMGQGETTDQAIIDLGNARIDYIHSLLEDGLPIPEPVPLQTATKTSDSVIVTWRYPEVQEPVPYPFVRLRVPA